MPEYVQPSPKKLRQCHECGEWFSERTTMFDLVIRLQAETPEVLDLDKAESEATSPLEEMERLLELLDEMTPDEAAEAEAEVFEEFRYLVCPECRRAVALKLRQKANQIAEYEDGTVEEVVAEELPVEEIDMPDAASDPFFTYERDPSDTGGFSFPGRGYQLDPDTGPH